LSCIFEIFCAGAGITRIFSCIIQLLATIAESTVSRI